MSLATYLTENLADTMDLFVDNFLSTKFRHEHFHEDDVKKFKDAFNNLAEKIINAKSSLERHDYLHLVELNLQHNIPYVVFINELGFIKNRFIHTLLENAQKEGVIALCKLFDSLHLGIAEIYLKHFIKVLRARNSIRIHALSDMQQNIVCYYEAHIRWLDELVVAVEQQDVATIPELDPSKCTFGKWLIGDGVNFFSHDSKYKELIALHQSLHFVGAKIHDMIRRDCCDCHAGMTYLEKAEFLSLQIGTELALIDNKMIMATATKDPLTNLLNRSLLEQMFYDQYEIALITQKHFVLVMCDLDKFKQVNDNHGHAEGDFILKLVAETLETRLRKSDLIFRYGGDEFVMILPASQRSDAEKLLYGVKDSFRDRLADHGRERLTLSMGMLEIKPTVTSVSKKELFEYHLKLVDQRLYISKENGGNHIE